MAPTSMVFQPLQPRRLIRRPTRFVEKETKTINPIRQPIQEPVAEEIPEPVVEPIPEPVVRTLRPRAVRVKTPKVITPKPKTKPKPKTPKEQTTAKPIEPKTREIALNNILTTAPPLSKEGIELLQDLYYKKMMIFGRDKLYKYIQENHQDVKISRRQIADWLKQQEINQLNTRHKQAKNIKSTDFKTCGRNR